MSTTTLNKSGQIATIFLSASDGCEELKAVVRDVLCCAGFKVVEALEAASDGAALNCKAHGSVLVLAASMTLDIAINIANDVRMQQVPILAVMTDEQSLYRRSLLAAKLGVPVVSSGDHVRLLGHTWRPFWQVRPPLLSNTWMTQSSPTAPVLPLKSASSERFPEALFDRAHRMETSQSDRHLFTSLLAPEGNAILLQSENLQTWWDAKRETVHDLVAIRVCDLHGKLPLLWLQQFGVFRVEIADSEGDLILFWIDRVPAVPPAERPAAVETWLDSIDCRLMEHNFAASALVTTNDSRLLIEYREIPSDVPLVTEDVLVTSYTDLVVVTGITGLGDAVWLTASLEQLRIKHKTERVLITAPGLVIDIFQNHPSISTIIPLRACPDWRLGIGMSHALLANFLGIVRPWHYAELTWIPCGSILGAPSEHRPLATVFGSLLGLDPEQPVVHVAPTNMECEAAREYLEEHDLVGRFLIGVQFSGSTISKSWPKSQHTAFLSMLKRHLPEAGILNLDDVHRQQRLRIRASAAALAACDLFVGVDSIGGHLCAAAGVPTVTLFGYSRPRYLNGCRPLGPNVAVEPPFECACTGYQEGCYECLKHLPAEDVLRALAWWVEEGCVAGRWKNPLIVTLNDVMVVHNTIVHSGKSTDLFISRGRAWLEVELIAEQAHLTGHALVRLSDETSVKLAEWRVSPGRNLISVSVNMAGYRSLSLHGRPGFVGKLHVHRIRYARSGDEG